ncbi:RAD52 DNA repair protein [Cristinia sonorae]|uniref:RAD52 DNA repair protein n=1 Tax=Cristinia sonorae TaxID=1940300 RepID=A0A8K0UU25_9AGAR|nr:RAD52 DNA repair protein [Cristinia sonorae]
MAGSFSGHLVDSFLAAQTPRGPFGQHSPPVSTHGPLAFAPNMHGTFTQQSNASFLSDSTFMNLSEDTAKKIATLQAKLDRKLGPEFISQRPGPGGGMKLTYAEGWKIINLANEVFGFNGWSSSVVNLTTDFVDFSEETKRYNVGVTAIVRVTLRDGVFHEDIGYGMLENAKSKGAALDKCKKEAVTDGVKRSLRNFGNLLGNCLYDKSYTQEVVKIKVPPPKFNKDELYRRPEFDPNHASSSAVKQEHNPSSTTAIVQKPVSAVPPHMRPVTGPAAMSTPIKSEPVAGPSRHTTPANHPARPNIGLNTPIQTPQLPAPQNRPAQQQDNHPPRNQAASLAPAPAADQSRRVSFAPPPAKPPQAASARADDDDSFMMNSEDDAFFAGIDLGDGTLDEGLGGPIHFEEGTGEAEGDGEEFQAPSPIPEVQLPNQPVQPQPPQRLQQPQRPQQITMSRPPQPQVQPPRRHHTTASSTIASHTEHTDVAPKQETTSQRSTPSMGGFHFPPGVNPQAGKIPGAGGSANNLGARIGTSSSSSTSSVNVGVKRSADTMQGQRRPMQGMGLSHYTNTTTVSSSSSTASSASGWTTARREPLSTIHHDGAAEGGDAKRVRR